LKNNAPYSDITRTTLAVLGIGLLIVTVYWIIKPFLLAVLWASMIVTATWPLLLRAEKILRGRRNLAALAMTALLALLFIVPLALGLNLIVAYSDRIVAWIENISGLTLPLPPQWVDTVPVVGPKISSLWHDIVASSGDAKISDRLAPHAEEIAGWLFKQAGNPGKTILDFLLTVIISGILYATGDTAAQNVLRFVHRLAGDRGKEVAILAAKTIRGVALGVVVTAVIQSFAAAIGLAVSGVPAAALLGVVAFVLCLAQLGPSLVLIPAVIWLFWIGSTGWGIFLSIWTLLVAPIDNFLRPMLIRKSVDIPTLLLLAGVIGGLISLGIIGVFIGPVILAVTYNLFDDWIKEDEDPEK
jgi:predicted PurR-regulated permease PerM